MKKPFYKRWWFIALIVIVIIGIFANLGDDNNSANDSKTTTTTTTKKEEKKVYKVGDTTKLHDAQITIKSAKLVNPQQYVEAEKGKVLVVEFECVNTGDSNLYIGTEEFKVSTPDGEQHEEYFGFDDGFMNENVGAGKKITKKMYFDVPQSDKYEMIYSPTFTLSSKTITFEITPK